MFTTLPSASVLPDGRGWELVSPPEKHGAAIEAPPLHAKDGIIQAAQDGSAITWLAAGPVGEDLEGNRSFERPRRSRAAAAKAGARRAW